VKGNLEEYAITEKEALKSKNWEKIMPDFMLACLIKSNHYKEI
jgi:hypothetical protein